MRWITEVDGCFYPCTCPNDLNVYLAPNLLFPRAKDWWKFVTTSYTPAEQAVVPCKPFMEMFPEEYMPSVERERLAQEYLLLQQTTETVTKIVRVFHDRALFYHNYTSNEQA